MPGAVSESSVEAPARNAFRLTLPGDRALDLDSRHPRVMGIVNITPDSFSDGGLWLEPGAAVECGLRMLEDGADLLDLGAESTRPGGGIYGDGAVAVDARTEWARLQPVLDGLRGQTERPISVDTRKAEVARRALDSGADLINDVSGLSDRALLAVVAEHGCPAVLMHSRGETATMQTEIHYHDVVEEVLAELLEAATTARDAGVEQLVLDPGIGFGKAFAHNLELVLRLPEIARIGFPVLLGTSRKGYLGALTGREPAQRVAAGLATVARALGSVHLLRVHDVAATVDFLTVWAAHDEHHKALRGQGLSGSRAS